MRDRWYSDGRDLVKWGSLVHLAKSHGLETILQVAFYLPEKVDCRLRTGNGYVDFPAVVWNHFRDLDGIQRLGQLSNLHIEVFKKPFVEQSKGKAAKGKMRTEHFDYFESLRRKITELAGRRLLVFLDPDTGIAPQRTTTKHVTASEIEGVFKAIKPGDWLAIYQHASRDRGWRGKARKKFAAAVGSPVQMFSSANLQTRQKSPLARDVVLLAVRKLDKGK